MFQSLDRKGTSGKSNSSSEVEDSSLDQKISQTLSWSSRVFEFSDLTVQKVRTDNVFLLSFQLQRRDGDSGKTLNPENPVHLSLKAEGKEIALLSGLLSRTVSIQELKHQKLVSQQELMSEVSELREENANLRQEVDNLYEALERIQRPRLVS